MTPRRTRVISSLSGGAPKSAEPHALQKIFANPPGGFQLASSSEPATTCSEPGAIRAVADEAPPVRRWQRVQWQ